MKQEILVWYWRNGQEILNLGEHFTPFIVRSFGYRTRDYDDAKCKGDLKKYGSCLMVIGSELHKEQIDSLDVPEVLVWGQGKGLLGEQFDFDVKNPTYSNKVKIYAVRGPYTARQLNLDPSIPLGDPTFLLPYIFPIQRQDDGNIRYVPHHKNRLNIKERLNLLEANEFINVMIKREYALISVRKIVSSKLVLTNSLHCAIIAHSYKVPWAISLVENEELDMPDKWRDVFEFLGIYNNFSKVSNWKEGYQWWNEVARNNKIPSLLPLIESFPYTLNKKGVKIIEKLKRAKSY